MPHTGYADAPSSLQAHGQGKGKQPKARAAGVQPCKGKQPKDKKSKVLHSAVMAEYAKACSYWPPEAVPLWSVSHVRTLASDP